MSPAGDVRASTRAPIDVIVPTRDRPHDLPRMLGALAVQTHRDFRVLVFDQSADPGQNSASIKGLADPRFAHIVDDRRGKSLALNDGVRASTASILAFTDDDCTPAPDWLERSLTTFETHESVGLLFGNVIAYDHDDHDVFVPAREYRRATSYRGPVMRSHGVIGMGANMVVRRSALATTGLFDEDLGPGGRLRTGEDCELTYRMLRHGHVVLCDHELDVVHHGGRSIVGDVAADYVIDSYFAIGAGYGKHMRTGDVRAAAVALHELSRAGVLALASIVRRRRPFHVRRITGLVRGVIAGWRVGPNWPDSLAPRTIESDGLHPGGRDRSDRCRPGVGSA